MAAFRAKEAHHLASFQDLSPEPLDSGSATYGPLSQGASSLWSLVLILANVRFLSSHSPFLPPPVRKWAKADHHTSGGLSESVGHGAPWSLLARSCL